MARLHFQYYFKKHANILIFSETFHIIINVENCLMFCGNLCIPSYKSFHKNIKQPFSALIIIEQQISISDWFLKDHVTLKTGVMMLKIQLWHHRNKLICFKLQKYFSLLLLFPCDIGLKFDLNLFLSCFVRFIQIYSFQCRSSFFLEEII